MPDFCSNKSDAMLHVYLPAMPILRNAARFKQIGFVNQEAQIFALFRISFLNLLLLLLGDTLFAFFSLSTRPCAVAFISNSVISCFEMLHFAFSCDFATHRMEPKCHLIRRYRHRMALLFEYLYRMDRCLLQVKHKSVSIQVGNCN